MSLAGEWPWKGRPEWLRGQEVGGGADAPVLLVIVMGCLSKGVGWADHGAGGSKIGSHSGGISSISFFLTAWIHYWIL